MNPFELMKAVGSIQSQMKTIKEELSRLTVKGSAGAGLVEATVNGDFLVQSISISDAAYALDDRSALQVLVASAVNDAICKAKEAVEAKSREVLQGAERM